jgi:hypothetical protein
MHITLFGLRPNKSETIRQKNLKKFKFYHVGLLIIYYIHTEPALASYTNTYNLRTTEPQGMKTGGDRREMSGGGGQQFNYQSKESLLLVKS